MDLLDALIFGTWAAEPRSLKNSKRIQALDRKLAGRIRRRFASQEERIEALEAALGRVAMLARALAELGLSKGAFTSEELERALLEADLADGQSDGGLDPEVALPGEERTADLEPLEGPREGPPDGPPGGGA